MKKVLSLLIILALIVVAWVFASPYWAVYQLKKAYDAQQADTISARMISRDNTLFINHYQS